MNARKTSSHLKLAVLSIGTIILFSALFVFMLNPYNIELKTNKKPVSMLGNYLNSHIIRVHVDKKKDWLMQRLKYRDYIRLVSTYYNLDIAEESIAAVINSNIDRIEHWVRDQTITKNMRKSFRSVFEGPVGYGISRENPNKVIELNTVKVVIQKVNNHSYKIITSYPIPTKR